LTPIGARGQKRRSHEESSPVPEATDLRSDALQRAGSAKRDRARTTSGRRNPSAGRASQARGRVRRRL